MTDPQVFRDLGLVVTDEFLEEPLCSRLSGFARSHAVEPAQVSYRGKVMVDERSRRARWLDVSEDLLKEVETKLSALIPALAKRFKVPLSSYQRPHLIRYSIGDFHGIHVDSAGDMDTRRAPASKVSCVVFLNEGTTAGTKGGFRGGELAFYCLTARPTLEDYRMLLKPQRGRMVAFGSGTYHEVLPVCDGERYTLATWFS
jgi:predicted 2-oxoglutarate/Fe(II)-dependent dioxygenase YbiX